MGRGTEREPDKLAEIPSCPHGIRISNYPRDCDECEIVSEKNRFHVGFILVDAKYRTGFKPSID